MHDCGADIEILVDGVLKVQPEKRFSLHREKTLILKSYAYALPGVDYALVGDCNDTHCIVDRIIAVFHKLHPSGHYNDRASGHIHCVQSDLRARRSLI